MGCNLHLVCIALTAVLRHRTISGPGSPSATPARSITRDGSPSSRTFLQRPHLDRRYRLRFRTPMVHSSAQRPVLLRFATSWDFVVRSRAARVTLLVLALARLSA